MPYRSTNVARLSSLEVWSFSDGPECLLLFREDERMVLDALYLLVLRAGE